MQLASRYIVWFRNEWHFSLFSSFARANLNIGLLAAIQVHMKAQICGIKVCKLRSVLGSYLEQKREKSVSKIR